MHRHASLNKAFRTIWNQSRQCFMAVAEFVRGKGGGVAGSAVTRAVGAALFALLGVVNSSDALATCATDPQSTSVTIDANCGAFEWNGSAGTVEIGSTGTVTGATGSYTPAWGGTARFNGAIVLGGSGSTMTGMSNNGLITTTGWGGLLAVQQALITSGVSNTGTIAAGSTHNAIQIGSRATLAGGINNSGLITANQESGIVTYQYGQIQNGIYNSTAGTISSNLGTAIRFTTGAQLSGGLANYGLIRAGKTAVYINNSSVTGDIVNQGLITSSGASRRAVEITNNSLLTGSIVNAGTIGAAGHGIELGMSARITGDISNAGLISASSTSWGNNSGVVVFSGALLSGSIVNQSAGSIAGANYGVYGLNWATIGGTLLNYGSITGGSAGVKLENYALLAGGIVNHNFISSINVQAATITGATAIKGMAGSTIAGGITNSGLIEGTSGIAIAHLNAGQVVNVVNTIADVTDSGGAVIGTTVGTVVGAINGFVNVTNSGLWALQTSYSGTAYAGLAFASITGNYYQSASGLLQVGVNDHGTAGYGTSSGNYSNLTVGGSATFDSGARMYVSMNASTAVLDGGTLIGVVTAANGITSSGFSINDNSGLVDFVASTSSNSLDLVAVTHTGCGATVTGNQTGPCEVAFDTPNLYVASSGSIGGAAQGVSVLPVTSGVINGRILNEGYIGATSQGVRFQSNTYLVGGLTNTGEIQGGYTGVAIGDNGVLAAGLMNNGSIVGTNQGINLWAGGQLSGGITNKGLIAGFSAIRIASNAQVSGGINNSGTIEGRFVPAPFGAGIAVISGGNLAGGLTNSGRIQGNLAGVLLDSYGALSGGIINTGSIIGMGGGILFGNPWAGSPSTGYASIRGGVTNSGFISGSYGAGIAVLNYGTLNGGIANTGIIQGGSTGLLVRSASRLTGGVTNAGVISGNGYGINVLACSSSSSSCVGPSDPSRITGGIVNTGSILGGMGVGIGISTVSTLVGNISNTGVISGGESAIAISGFFNGEIINDTAVVQGVTKRGLIQGAINVSGGSYPPINNVVNRGRWSMATPASTGPYYSSSQLWGNYTQSENALLRIGANSTNSGEYNALGVFGVATFAGDAHLDVRLNAGYTLTGGAVLATVVGAMGPVLNAGNWIVTDNSTLFDFNAVNNGNTLDLVAVSNNTGCGGTVSGSIGSCEIGVDAPDVVVDGPAGGTINGSFWRYGVRALDLSGSITNSGYVGGTYGIQVVTSAVMSGGIYNSGTIEGYVGISIAEGAVVTGGIVNAPGGYISSINNTGQIGGMSASKGVSLLSASISSGITNTGLVQGYDQGIHIDRSTLSGGIFNQGSIIGGTGIGVRSAAQVNGGITNTGLIHGLSSEGIDISAGSTLSGGIANSSSILGTVGILAWSSLIEGGITNSGLIQGVNQGIHINRSTLSGGIFNQGSIIGGTGIGVWSAAQVNGGITNTGLIHGLSSEGIDISTGSTLLGGIVNRGTIHGLTGIGIWGASQASGGITNTGAIIGINYAGIAVRSSSVLTGGISNTGLIAGADGTAIANYNASNVINIVNTVSGNQVGTIVGAINGDANVSNSGLWALHAYGNVGAIVSSSISGNYSQDARGMLRIGGTTDGISNSYSTLTVGGAVEFANNANLDIRFSANTTLAGTPNLIGVVTAGTLNQTGFNVTDNSALWDYSATVTGSQIDLGAYASRAPTGTISTSVTGPGLVAFDAPIMLVDTTGSITGTNTGIKVLAGDVNGSITNQGYVFGDQYGVLVSQSANLSGGIYNMGTVDGMVGIAVSQGATVQGGIFSGPGSYIRTIYNAGRIGGTNVLEGINLIGANVEIITNSGVVQGGGGRDKSWIGWASLW